MHSPTADSWNILSELQIFSQRVQCSQFRRSSHIESMGLIHYTSHRPPSRAFDLKAASLVRQRNTAICDSVDLPKVIQSPDFQDKLWPKYQSLSLTIHESLHTRNYIQKDEPKYRFLRRLDRRCGSEEYCLHRYFRVVSNALRAWWSPQRREHHLCQIIPRQWFVHRKRLLACNLP